MSLINTRIQNLRASSNLDKYEYRASNYGGIDLFLAETKNPAGIISDELIKKAEMSIGSTLEIPVIQYDSGVSIGNTRSVTIADDLNTSAMVTASWTPYSWGFTAIPARHHNNEIALQRDFEASFWKYLYKFAETIDTAAITALSTGKTQVFNEDLGIYTIASNTVRATNAQRERILGDLGPLMSGNDFSYGQLRILGNMGLMAELNQLAKSGLYNSENKQLEYMDKVFHFSNRVINPEGRYATAYAVVPGSIGVLFRFERESLLNTRMEDGTQWGISTLPLLNIPVGTYYYESKGDFNAVDGAATADMTRVRKQHYGFAVDVCFLTAYNSSASTIPSPIMKVTINTSVTDADTTAPAVSTVVSSTKTGAVVTFTEALCSDTYGTLLTGDVSAYITSPATGSTTCTLTTATADATGKIWTLVNVAGDVAATDTFDLAAAVYDANGNALASGTHIVEMNAGATAWEKP
jgi:hypothetical protein